jgi:hypothetical protein
MGLSLAASPASPRLREPQWYPVPLKLPVGVAPDQCLLLVSADLIEIIDFAIVEIMLVHLTSAARQVHPA